MSDMEKDLGFESLHLNPEDSASDLAGVITELEDAFLDDVEEINANTPDPLAPLRERVAHRLRLAHVRATSDVLAELRTAQNEVTPQ